MTNFYVATVDFTNRDWIPTVACLQQIYQIFFVNLK